MFWIFRGKSYMKKERIIIFGAGGLGKKLYKDYKSKNDVEIVAFADNFKTGILFDLPILKPKDLLDYKFDSLIITAIAVDIVEKQLRDLGLPQSKICKSFRSSIATARNVFLIRFAEEVKRKNLAGSVAEAGVFEGYFAAKINENFPNKELYLFDTFSGFDKRDTILEEGYDNDPHRGDHFKNVSKDMVLAKLKYPQNCIIRQGYVPETLQGLETKKFCFVNLDMDLYQPTLAALEWFWPRMVEEGVILIHDYFEETGTYPNLKKAVIKFTSENKILSLPIGDDLSIALIKN